MNTIYFTNEPPKDFSQLVSLYESLGWNSLKLSADQTSFLDRDELKVECGPTLRCKPKNGPISEPVITCNFWFNHALL